MILYLQKWLPINLQSPSAMITEIDFDNIDRAIYALNNSLLNAGTNPSQKCDFDKYDAACVASLNALSNKLNNLLHKHKVAQKNYAKIRKLYVNHMNKTKLAAESIAKQNMVARFSLIQDRFNNTFKSINDRIMQPHNMMSQLLSEHNKGNVSPNDFHANKGKYTDAIRAIMDKQNDDVKFIHQARELCAHSYTTITNISQVSMFDFYGHFNAMVPEDKFITNICYSCGPNMCTICGVCINTEHCRKCMGSMSGF